MAQANQDQRGLEAELTKAKLQTRYLQKQLDATRNISGQFVASVLAWVFSATGVFLLEHDWTRALSIPLLIILTTHLFSFIVRTVAARRA